MIQVLQGNTLDVLKTLPDASVQMCVTSPPYWGLRSYLPKDHPLKPFEIGSEKTPAEYVAKMVKVFQEVKRVLRDDGTCWVNLGDCYNGSGRTGGMARIPGTLVFRGAVGEGSIEAPGLKAKDLVGMPWRVAFGLQADGWYLRSDIIWHKPNPMPESVSDRPTKAHEYVFLLSKCERYFYDAEAIKEPVTGGAHARGDGVNPKARWKTPDGWDTSKGEGGHGSFHREGREKGKKQDQVGKRQYTGFNDRWKCKQNESFSAVVNGLVEDRNKRTVWTVPTYSFKEAHFATFPPDLIRPCILAGSKLGDIVLDPFGGSGTTGQVSLELGRKAILIELNPDYLPMIQKRTTNLTPGLL